jgi:hypothetical protein
MSLYLLVAIFLLNGSPQIGVELFPSQDMCKAAIPAATAELIAKNIQSGSVTCQEIKIGDFA